MKKLLTLLLFSFGLNAQTITTNFQNTSICFGEQVSVPFAATGFPSGTEYKVQLLDKDGGTVLYDNVATGTSSPINFDATNIRIGAFAIKVMAVNQLTMSSVASSGLLFVGPYAKMSNANGNDDDVSVALGDSATLKVNLYGAAPWVFTYSDGTFQHTVKTSSNPYFLKVAPKQNTRYSITKVSNACGTNTSLDNRVTVLLNTITSLTLPTPQNLNICGGGSVKIPLTYTGNWSNDVALRVFLTDDSGLYIPNSEQIINYKADTVNFLLPNDLVVNKEYKIRVVVTKPYLLINYLNSTYKLTATGNNCTPEATLLAAEPSCGGTVLQAYPRDNTNTYQYQWFKNNILQPEQSKNYFFAADSAQYHVKITKAGYNSVSDSVLVWQKAMEVSLESPNPFLCNPGDLVTVNAFPNTAGYTYFWFADSTTNGQTSKALLSTITTASFQTTQPKFYEVTIQKDGCERTLKLPISDKATSSGFVYVDGGTENRGYVMLSGYDKIESIQSNVNPAEAYYFANQSITLLPGFMADNSTLFKAEIKGCSVGNSLIMQEEVVYAQNPINTKFLSLIGNTIKYTSSTETEAIKVGDVIYSLPFGNQTKGYALKVLTKTTQNGEVTFATRKATFAEVFEEINDNQEYKLDLTANQPVIYDPMPSTTPNARKASTNSTGNFIGDVLSLGSERFKKLNIEDNVASIEFVMVDFDKDYVNTKEDQLILSFDFDYSGMNTYFTSSLTNRIFALNGNHNYKVKASIKYEPELSFQESEDFIESFKKDLLGRRIKFISAKLTPLSVSNIAIQPTFDVFLNVEIGISGKLEIYASVENIGYSFNISNIYDVNGNIQPGKWKSDFRAYKNPKFDAGIVASAEANFKLGIGAGFTLNFPVFDYEDGLDSYIGIYGDINLNLELKAEAKLGILTDGLECETFVARPFFDWGFYVDGKFGYLGNTVLELNQYIVGPSEPIEALEEKHFNFCEEPEPNDPLVAFYPFNGNTNDESQFDNHLTVTNATMTTDRNGEADKAAYFNGTNAFMTVANSKTPKSAKDRTISLWFKTDGTTFNGGSGQSLGTLLDYGTFETQKRFSMQLGGTSASIGKGKMLISNLQNDVYPQTDYGDDKWHYAALVYQSNRLVLYIDGKIVKSSTQSLNTTGNELTIGRTITNTLGFTQYFKGAIDDIKVYNKALNSIEIEEVYQFEAPPAPDLTSGLVAHYKFEDNFLDETDNNNDGVGYGTVNGGVSFVASKNGSGKAAKFDGVDDYISSSFPSQSLITNETTVSSWIKINALDKGWFPIFEKPTNSNQGSFIFAYGTPNLFFNPSGVSGTPYFTKTLATNVWYNYVVTYNGTVRKFFIDGELIGSLAASGQINLTNTNLEIGRDTPGLVEYTNGLLDDIRIYNRALTDEEVLQLYNEEKPQPDLTSGLVAHYKFEDNFLDETENNNDGTESGGVTFENGRNGAGKAAKFDGTSGCVSYGNQLLNNLGSYTVSLWMKNNENGSSVKTILSKEQTNVSQSQFRIFQTNNNVSFLTTDQNYSSGDNGLWSSSNGYSLNTNVDTEWSFITIRRSGTLFSVFSNGNLIVSKNSLSEITFSNTRELLIGANLLNGSKSQFYPGSIDDIRIYNRALTDEEVLQLYNEEKPTETIDLQSGLVAYYPFNGNANDEAGNNDGVVNGATLTTDRYGSSGKAYSFDGVNDKINRNVGPELSSLEKTISVWAMITGAGNTNPRFVGVGPAGNSSQYYSLILEGTTNLRRIWFHTSAAVTNSYSNTFIQNSSLWKNYTVTFKNNTVKMFIDGVLDKETKTTGSLVNFSSAVLQIGYSDNGLDWYEGKLDDIRIYNRALSDVEVQTLYNQEKP